MLSHEEPGHVRALHSGRRFGRRTRNFLTDLMDPWYTPKSKQSDPQIEVSENPDEGQEEDILSSTSSLT